MDAGVVKVEQFKLFGAYSGTLAEQVEALRMVAEHAELFLTNYIQEVDGERIKPLLKLAESPGSTMSPEQLLREWLYMVPNMVTVQHFYNGSGVTGINTPPESGPGLKTLVVHSAYKLALLYHNGRFVYAIKEPSDDFWRMWHRLRMPPSRNALGERYGEVVEVAPWSAG